MTETEPGSPSHRSPEAIEADLTGLDRRFPFIAPQLVVLAAILLDLSLSTKVTVGPPWLLPSLEGVLVIAFVAVSPHPRVRHSPLRRRIALALIGLVSVANIISLVLLSRLLLKGKLSNGHALIGSGIVLWVTNVLLFGLWYWELDRGGPMSRLTDPGARPDFLFPQMDKKEYAPPGWIPSLVDYLYLSFTNATAFSPTDTMPLTAIAKWLMATQATAALVTIGLVVARAVNILQA
jgi:hypothetical protein